MRFRVNNSFPQRRHVEHYDLEPRRRVNEDEVEVGVFEVIDSSRMILKRNRCFNIKQFC